MLTNEDFVEGGNNSGDNASILTHSYNTVRERQKRRSYHKELSFLDNIRRRGKLFLECGTYEANRSRRKYSETWTPTTNYTKIFYRNKNYTKNILNTYLIVWKSYRANSGTRSWINHKFRQKQRYRLGSWNGKRERSC